MKGRILMVVVAGVALLLLARPAAAEVLVVEPELVAVVDGGGVTRVGLKFDLSGVPEGAVVDDAYVEWTVASLEAEATVGFTAYAATAVWTQDAGPGTPDEGVAPPVEWEITPMDQARTGGLVRLYVRDVVDAWRAGRTANHGLVVQTADVSRTSMESALPGATLTLRYGFR